MLQENGLELDKSGAIGPQKVLDLVMTSRVQILKVL